MGQGQEYMFPVVEIKPESLEYKLPVSKYRCQKCKSYFEKEKPGPVECQKCGGIYIDWLNSEEVVGVARELDNRFK